MPRKRKPENKGLPARWRFVRNAYYYQVPPGCEYLWEGKQTFKLGNTLSAAYVEWANRIPKTDKANTIGQLLDRYASEVIPTKAPITQKNDRKYIKKLRAVFGNMPINSIEPRHVYSYVDRGTSRSLALKEKKLLSHAYTKAVEWGYMNKHPFKFEVRLKGEAPRDRYVEDWEIVECLALSSKRKAGSIKAIQAYIKIKLLTGLDRSDLLRVEMSDLKEDGIHNQRHKNLHRKTQRKTIYEWTDELRSAVEDAKSVRPRISPFLFCTKSGDGYYDESTGEAHGWSSMWQRFMARVLKETKVTDRFTEKDLRAKCASDADSLEHARALLAHADSKITQKVYRRKPERVKPRTLNF